ncbi:MAG: phosphotransferase, partial [Halobacteriaceae archaeon]
MVSKGDVREALTTIEGINWTESAIKSVRAIDDGVNDTFLITIASNKEFDSTQIPDKDRLFIKFATFSRPESLTAGIAAYRLLSRYTNLPVPSVYAVSFEATELPAFYVAEYLPGDLLEDPTDPHNPIAARKLGQVIADLGSIPSASTNGYGMIKEWQSSKPPAVCAPYDDFATWLVEYAEMLYNDLPEHHKLEQVASDVPAFIRANMEQV